MSTEWPYKARRTIRYVNILLKSRQPKEAVGDFEQTMGEPAAPAGRESCRLEVLRSAGTNSATSTGRMID
jgi:hypothetical protein